MNQCQFEEQVIAAVRLGNLSEKQKQHMASCASCREVYQTVTMLSQVASLTEVEVPPMPDPRLLWLKAELNAPKQSSVLLHVISVAVLVGIMSFGAVLYRIFLAPKHLPENFSGSVSLPSLPIPLDSGFIIIALAIALVFLVPKVQFSFRAPKSDSAPLSL